MNKNDSNEQEVTQQDVYDQLINLVTTLKPIIDGLQGLTQQADEVVATRLNHSLNRIDSQVDEVSAVIEALGSSVSMTSEALDQSKNQLLEQLQVAVTAFTDNELPHRYDEKIPQIIEDIKQQLNTAVDTVVTAKNDSLEAQVTGMQGVADELGASAATLATFTSSCVDGHGQIIDSIEKLDTAAKKWAGQVEDRAGKDLDGIYRSIQSMSIKKILAAIAVGTIAMILSLVALVFWYVPSFNDIADLRSQQAELQQGITELETGWKQAFDNAQSEQFIFACDVNKEKPDVISWCVRADSKSFLKDDKGSVYYKVAEVKREKDAE